MLKFRVYFLNDFHPLDSKLQQILRIFMVELELNRPLYYLSIIKLLIVGDKTLKFSEKRKFLTPDTHKYVCVSGG